MGLNHYDVAYLLGLGLSAPVWLVRGKTRRKVLAALAHRMGKVMPRTASTALVMIHAVSVGEINATRAMIDLLRRQRPDLKFLVTVTTDTGYARGQDLYGKSDDVTLERYPLDFSFAIERFLDALRPSVVALMELEVWPNFIRHCQRRRIPVLLINGRITPTSFSRYKLARPLISGMFRRIERICAQEEIYARRFIELGAMPQRLTVTGSMKFDTAAVADDVSGQEQLAQAVGLISPSPGPKGAAGTPGEGRGEGPVWVCGSTGPGEESIILSVYRNLLSSFAGLRLVIVPRKPDRFDEVAELIVSSGFPLLRRSKPVLPAGGARPVILGDSMGELRAFYALADVVFVGRTLVDLGSKQHGSDMIEPAALAKPVIVGPFTGNFAEAMNQFRADQAMIEVDSAASLQKAAEKLLSDPAGSAAMSQRARAVVRRCQGATALCAAEIVKCLLPGEAAPDNSNSKQPASN